MIRRLLLAACFALLSYGTQAQAFEPGYLVRSTGDTLRGEIENGFWVEPPTFIRFRFSPSSPSQVFQPRQLRVVSFTGDRYFRYEALPIDYQAETRIERLSHSYKPSSQIDSLLAEVLLEGDVSLLRVAQPGAQHYFLVQQGRPTLELSERKYLRDLPKTKNVMMDANNYKGQLLVYFGTCAAASEAVPTTLFTPKSLVKLVELYNKECGAARVPGRQWLPQAKPRRRLSLQGGLVAGMRYNRIESGSPRLAGKCVDCETHPFAGLYADLLQPSRTTAIYGELTLSRFKSQGAHYAYDPVTKAESTTEFNYRATMGTARIGVRYFMQLPREHQLLLTVGYELNSVFESSASVTTTSGRNYSVPKDDLIFASTTLFPNVGLGWRYQRLTVNFDGQMYIASKEDDLSGIFVGSNHALRLSLGYRLSKNPDVTLKAPAPLP
ncbi:hypothetical protein LGH70_18105 [Hymenobacter sp. BT635]|uniref:Outer membrane protein beta-barrel domain-containing protein n=1 Tax=Hymenobacter nitidus TaxID=2880929 RepID=A0ABS8AGX3_9BACT|nr:hypothetical protein [Hymenobacter nitidus]MCB2379516.1 hypothetical protein [Hymenobacter nitidus]